MLSLAALLLIMSLFLLGFWALLIWGCASIAKGKGRSPIAWGFLGLFFGLFALLLIAILPPLSPQNTPR